MSTIDYKSYFEKAISYETYLQNFQDEIALGNKSDFAQYLPQNWQRQSRLDRKFKLREDLQTAIQQLNQKQHWLVITEHWCGDASQINPIIHKAAEANKDKIQLRFFYRDEDTTLIDQHLTGVRSRSIPILLQFDEEFNLINSYGPRPEEAQKLVLSLLAKNEDYNIPVHTWYAKDKQQTIQLDLLKILNYK